MKRILAALAFMFLAVAPGQLAADPPDIAAAARSVVRVVLILDDGAGAELVGHGSGFAVGPNLVVTNAHVVAEAMGNRTMRVGIVPAQGRRGYFAKIIAHSPGNDLALLKLSEAGTLVPTSLFTGPVSDGQDVWAVGYPGNVDVAQGFSAADYMTPTAPVKTHGTVSSGRSNRQYDTILHNASIASGSSGGPLLDGCGRVIGVNTYGTSASSGTDSQFYFSVSMREISRFLLTNGVRPVMTGEPCRSQAEFLTAEEQRMAEEKAMLDNTSRTEAAKRDADLARATRQAELNVIALRENHMALAAIALLFAVIAGGAAFFIGQQGKVRERNIAATAVAALLVGAIIAWATRPAISEIASRASEMLASSAPPDAATSAAAQQEGAMICVIDLARSRVTVSPTTDVPLDWRADGCANNQTQYGLGVDGWSWVLVPNFEDNVSVAAYDPATRTYRIDRFLLDAEAMTLVRQAKARHRPPLCGGGAASARALGESQAGIKALLPGQPNERLVYKCTAMR